jgi:ABC-type Na+ efflux pump permease subunit
MLPGPIFRREVKAGAGRYALFVARIVLGALLAAIAVLPAIFHSGPYPRFPGSYTLEDFRDYWGVIFVVIAITELCSLVFLAASTVSNCITQEREKNTLALLLLTRLTRFELVATKFAGRLLPNLSLLSTGLPLLLLSAGCAWLPELLVLEIVAVLLSSILVATSLAILASAQRERSSSAQVDATGWTMLWFAGFPMFTLLPARSGTLAGDILVELRRVASWIAPSSPMSVFTDPSWFIRTDAEMLSDRLLLMLALQMLLIALALIGAVANLRLRDPHPSSRDPHRGYRPPVGDDPIYWRESVLPRRGSRWPVIVTQVRYMWILTCAILKMTLHLAILTIAVAVPIAIAISVGWLGVRAFQEEIGLKYFGGGPDSARLDFNVCIRCVTALVGVIPTMATPASILDRFTRERDKRTWESLLTTSLSGPEILWAKTRVLLRGLLSSAAWIIPLWLLGILCGSLHPLGALLAAADLVALLWLGVAVGIWLGIRPGFSTRVASFVCAFVSLAMLFLGGFAIIVPLCTIRQFDDFWNSDPVARWVIIALLLAAQVTVSLFARSRTRRCFQNFDNWVGRPHREPGNSSPPRIHPVPTATNSPTRCD